VRVEGADATHRVEKVTFDNVVRYGQRLHAASTNLVVGPFTSDVVYAARPPQ
jgi:hypothetical protein